MTRSARGSDAAEIAEIYNGYVTGSTVSFETEPVSVEEMTARIGEISAAYPFLVCEEDGLVVGFCYAHRWKERAAYARTVESSVYVSPQRRGRGIGKALMAALVEQCRNRGYRVVIAGITAENLASERFHESLGFKRVSRFEKVGYKFGRWLDVVDYELLL